MAAGFMVNTTVAFPVPGEALAGLAGKTHGFPSKSKGHRLPCISGFLHSFALEHFGRHAMLWVPCLDGLGGVPWEYRGVTWMGGGQEVALLSLSHPSLGVGRDHAGP